MKYIIISEDFCRPQRDYGLYKIVRETPKRWWFEHVAGTDFGDDRWGGTGHVFNYHSKPWLDKHMARNRAVAWIEDPSMFDSVVASHKKMEAEVKDIRERSSDWIDEERKWHANRIANYIVGAPE